MVLDMKFYIQEKFLIFFANIYNKEFNLKQEMAMGEDSLQSRF